MTQLRLACVVVVTGVVLCGCGQDPEPVADRPQASQAADVRLALRPARSSPIVTFHGRVNGGRPLAADLASLEALPSRKMTVLEPFVKQSVTFTGVEFADLLTAVRARGSSVTIHALDDYEATIDSAVLREPGVMLATQADGQAIDVSDGGPVRLVFPASSKEGKDSDLWVWSIDKISVE